MSDPIVTLDEAKLWLRVDTTDDDEMLETLIGAATEAALTTADALAIGDPIPLRLKLAVLAHVARCYDGREGVDAPEGNARLLMPLRTLDV